MPGLIGQFEKSDNGFFEKSELRCCQSAQTRFKSRERNWLDLLDLENSWMFEKGLGKVQFPPIVPNCCGMWNDYQQGQFVIIGVVA